jgi:hypothetical protein
MPDPVIGDSVWYVLGTGTIDGQMFAQFLRFALERDDIWQARR